jgi:transposase
VTAISVLTGPERRRRWTSAEKARIVEESLAPGKVVAAVARQHDVHPNLLHQWRRQARGCGAGDRSLQFLPIEVAEPTGAAEAGRASGTGSIEIELADVRVRVASDVDEAALRLVLRVLGR